MIEVMGGAYTIGTDNSVWGNYKDLSSYKYNTEYWRNRLDQTWHKAYALILNCNKILGTIDGNKNMFTDGSYYIIKGVTVGKIITYTLIFLTTQKLNLRITSLITMGKL